MEGTEGSQKVREWTVGSRHRGVKNVHKIRAQVDSVVTGGRGKSSSLYTIFTYQWAILIIIIISCFTIYNNSFSGYLCNLKEKLVFTEANLDYLKCSAQNAISKETQKEYFLNLGSDGPCLS